MTPPASEPHPRIGILVVAYNAESTLAQVLDRIPRTIDGLTAVLVSDDHSADATHAVAEAYAARHPELPVTAVRQARNLGYGGNQKYGYRWAIDHGLDIVVLLHGDGQYAPELLPDMVEPIRAGRADMVNGSRMMHPGDARRGGMPLYKYVGNRILTRYQNAVSGLELSEWHSGYRAFSVPALAQIPFEENSDDFDFDTEVLLQLAASGSRIVEIPIPTFYGDEICYVNGMAYAKDVTLDVTRMRLARMGFGPGAPGTLPEEYEWKQHGDTARARLAELLVAQPAGEVLDLGCADGAMARVARRSGHRVVGIDVEKVPGAEESVDRLVIADLDQGLPGSVLDEGRRFSTVVAADVLEHTRRPDLLLQQLHEVAMGEATLLTSVPNFGHWYPRLRVVFGRFDYDRRGILDADHVRFFTRHSFMRMARQSRWTVERMEAVGLPFEVVDRAGPPGLADRLRRRLGFLDGWLAGRWPSLFAYQFVVELRSAP